MFLEKKLYLNVSDIQWAFFGNPKQAPPENSLHNSFEKKRNMPQFF